MFVPPDSQALRYTGRFDRSDPSAPRLAWSGSTIAVDFTGTSVTLKLRESATSFTDDNDDPVENSYAVFVDSNPPVVVTTDKAHDTFPLVSNLPAGLHRLRLVKRTEAQLGDARFLGLILDPGATASAPAMPTRRLEFIGDSITAGYGVEGADESCVFTSATEDFTQSHAFLVGQVLNAEVMGTAVSGIGVTRQADPTNPTTMPLIYDRTFPLASSPQWSFSGWTPDAVVVNLLTNDFVAGDPGPAFSAAYRDFLAHLRWRYPNALILATLGPMLSDNYPAGEQQLTTARGYLSTAISDRHAAGDARVKLVEYPVQDGSLGYGCNWHPSAATQRLMAEQLETKLREELGW